MPQDVVHHIDAGVDYAFVVLDWLHALPAAREACISLVCGFVLGYFGFLHELKLKYGSEVSVRLD